MLSLSVKLISLVEDDTLDIDITLDHKNNISVDYQLEYPTVSSEARFCLIILSFCVKMQMRANDCFKIVQTLKEDKLTPSFLPYEPEYILPDLGVAAKSMQILYVVLSDLHHDGDEFSCAVSADGNVNALFYYGSDAVSFGHN